VNKSLLDRKVARALSALTFQIYVAKTIFTTHIKKKLGNLFDFGTRPKDLQGTASGECLRDACLATLKIATAASREGCTAGLVHHQFPGFHGREQLEFSKDSMAGQQLNRNRTRGRPP
jgi:hypothetical protein